MQVVEQVAPQFTVEEAAHIAETVYGLTASARPLNSHLDQNFLLEDVSGRAFVLKIANSAEDPMVIDLQQKTLDFLTAHHPRAAFHRVCPTVSGEALATVDGKDGARHLVWMVTYLPGRVMACVNPQTPALLRDLGRFLGEMDRVLEGFAHPIMDRHYFWDLRHASDLLRYLGYIKDPAQRALVELYFGRFEAEVVPVLPQLRTSVIQMDGNDHNILVDGKGEDVEITGLIDFGDVMNTHTVFEPAIAAAYVMLDKADPLAAAAHLIGGYHEAHPLTPLEIEVLFTLMTARLCCSVLVSTYRETLDPDNEYMTISQRPAWAALEAFAGVHPRFVHYTFRQACGLDLCPQTARVVTWLKDHAADLGPVVAPDLREEPPVVFDLSVGSLLIGNPEALADPASFADVLFGRMNEAGANVGVGRYDEARLVYTADQFRSGPEETAEHRTIHLGIDLFQEAGAPVFAPLNGVVHSFADNALPLDYGPTIILRHDVEEDLAFYTLYGHLSRASLDGLAEGQSIKKGERFAELGDIGENGDWVPHLHFQVVTDMLDYRGDFPGVARASERAVWLGLSPDPNFILGIPDECFPEEERSKDAILEARAQHIGRNLSVSYHQPLKMVRGFMQYLYDETGRAFLDAVNNVPHVGHSHPKVVRAAQRQMAVLNTNTRYLHDNLVRYAERLTATMPAPLRVCFFVNSGSEANDLALRLARAHTGQRDVIVLDGAYHGNLSSLIGISPYKFDGRGGSGAPAHVHKVVTPDPYRGRYRADDPEAGAKYARHVGEVIETMRQEGRGLAAFIAESLLGCGGQIECPEGYFREAYRSVRAAGGVCIADEVQVGFGRVGTHFWGFETQDVIPGIVVMGKPIGNAHPLAAVVTTPEIAASFDNGMEYFSTFGGNPVSCAVGLAVLDVIEDEGLQAHALRVGARLKAGLDRLKEKHPIVGDVRGRGLFLGVELVMDRETLEPAAAQATYVVNRMRERGILMSTDGPLHNVLKIKPPLVFTEANADLLVRALDAILAEDVALLDAD